MTPDHLADWASLVARDIAAVRDEGASPVLAVDLEGDLRARGRIELIQFCSLCPTFESARCVAVVDLRSLPAALDPGSPLRGWL